VRSWSDNWDVALSPLFSTQTKNGLTSLFTLKNADLSVANPWFVGLSISLVDLDPGTDSNSAAATALDREALLSVKGEVFDQCNKACRYDSVGRSDDECKAFDTWQQDRQRYERDIRECAKTCTDTECVKPNSDQCKTCTETCRERPPDFAIALSPDQMCKSGNTGYQHKYDSPHRDRRGRFPEWVVSVGGGWGLAEHKYLDAIPGAAGSVGVNDQTRSDVRIALSVTYVSTRSPLTLEWASYYRSVFDDSATTAQWCTPMVPVLDPKGGTAQVCKQLPQGAASNAQTLWTTLLAGYVSKPDGAWRAAIGPLASVDASGSSKTIGAQAPFYLNVGSLPGFVGDFKSIVRLTPIASYTFSSSGNTEAVGVVLDLIAQRNLFPRSLDWVK
jgi:hypothetical protein